MEVEVFEKVANKIAFLNSFNNVEQFDALNQDDKLVDSTMKADRAYTMISEYWTIANEGLFA